METATKPLFRTDWFEDFYPSERLLLPATDGQQVLMDADDIFHRNCIARELRDAVYCRAKPGWARPETEIKVLKMLGHLSFKTAYEALASDLKSLCLTQHQIREFCMLYPDKVFGPGVESFFLMKTGDVMKVDAICGSPGDRWKGVYMFDLDYNRAWHPRFPNEQGHYQFIIPLEALGK